MLGLLAVLFLWVAPGSAVIAVTGSATATPSVVHRTETARSSPNHAHPHDHAKKEGTLAVVLSVIGIIAVVAAVVALGSISARRRTRDGPPAWMQSLRGPPDRGRGPFG
jgi:UDP-N-acetylmuramyl pentapeptide phosphotransferase/UDP-N-acetylglucosamine-1-phosphate transferase